MNVSRLKANQVGIASSVIGVVIMAVLTILSGPFILVNSLVTGGMWSLVAVGLVLVFGVMNIANFAQGEFFMVGTLSAYLTFDRLTESTNGAPEWWITILCLASGLVAGLIVGFLTDLLIFSPMRRREREDWVSDTFVATIGLSVVLISAHQLLWGNDFKGIVGYWFAEPVNIFDVPVSYDRLMAVAVSFLALAGLWHLLTRTQFGRAIKAVAQDSDGARMMGIKVGRINRWTLGISSGLAALAGATLLFMFPASPYVGVQPLYIAWTIVILAGLGSVGGAVVGGFMVAMFTTATGYYLGSEWQEVMPFLLIIGVLMVRPNGLFGKEGRRS